MVTEAEAAADLVPVYGSPQPAIRKIELDRPWQWLLKGWQDLRRAPAVSFTYGVLAAVTGYLVTFGLVWADMLYLVLPLTAGFLIVGPILASRSVDRRGTGISPMRRRDLASRP